ncbi:hypothetical protein FQZ97_849430 [compost metagenome]
MTDVGRPGSNYPSESIETDDFEIIGANDVDIRHVPLPYERLRALPNDDPPPREYATGEGLGLGNKDIGKLTVNSNTVISSRAISADEDGFLWNMWKAFEHLHQTKQIRLHWFVPPSTNMEKGPPECTIFSERTAEQAKHAGWLDVGTGTRRGMLLLHIEAEGKQFLVVELQRKPPKEPSSTLRKSDEAKTTADGDSFCGLICQVESIEHLLEVHTRLDGELPEQKGVFKKLRTILPKKLYIFPHRPAGSMHWSQAAATLALKEMGIIVHF